MRTTMCKSPRKRRLSVSQLVYYVFFQLQGHVTLGVGRYLPSRHDIGSNRWQWMRAYVLWLRWHTTVR
jgi:hypothetical protein